MGSGAVFLNSSNRRVVINDLNSDVIDLHINIKFHFPELIKEVTKICNKAHDTEEIYYQFREKFNNLGSCVEKSALFLYINYYGFKGLIRYANGRINVPYHQGFAVSNYSFRKLHDSYQAIHTKDLVATTKDFRDILIPMEGVTVFADPPYMPSEDKTHCESYLGRGFGLKDHQDLVILAEEYRKVGSTFIISNHLTDKTRELYGGADKLIKLSRGTGIQHSSEFEIQEECVVVYGKSYTEKRKLF